MKNLLLLIVFLFVSSCDKSDTSTNGFTIVGDWTLENDYVIYEKEPIKVVLEDRTKITDADKKLCYDKFKYSYFDNGTFVFNDPYYIDYKCVIEENEEGVYILTKEGENIFKIRFKYKEDQSFGDNLKLEFSDDGNKFYLIDEMDKCSVSSSRDQEPCAQYLVYRRK